MKDSKSWIIWRTCISKRSLSFKEADDYITKKMNEGVTLYWYKCQFCSRYHISRQADSEHKLEVL